MAESSKRMSTGAAPPRVALPKKPVTMKQSQTVLPHVKELEKPEHVGRMVKITNMLNHDHVGRVRICQNDELVLDETPEMFRIIQLRKITDWGFAKLGSAEEKERERKAKEKTDRGAWAEAERLKKPDGVNALGHRLFLTLGNLLSARWQGKDIVVGKVTIKAPRYEPDECQIPDPKSLKQQGELEYIQKLIRTELSKMPKNTEGHKGG